MSRELYLNHLLYNLLRDRIDFFPFWNITFVICDIIYNPSILWIQINSQWDKQFSVTIGFTSRTITFTFRTAKVFASNSPIPDAPAIPIRKNYNAFTRPHVPPVTTMICSPQSYRPGPNNKLPWLRYNLEHHLANPSCKCQWDGILELFGVKHTEHRYGHIIASWYNNHWIRQFRPLEYVEHRDKERKEWTCKEKVRLQSQCKEKAGLTESRVC